ncbi:MULTISPECIES: MmgE/PrpD family protein [unclassified Streptomyces]|uniref:MmgE/PrpD family protein n=1 Tax=unclassified Streptomyces TaxID=2593676 RepID=UPI0006935357|nr:MmgE/PrpD family protein [Streptomyces sp. NBC_00370]
MDKTTDQLVSYARSFGADQLTGPVRTAAVDRIVDSVACAVVGSLAESARIAVESVRGVHSDRPATVFGAGLSTTPELAAFANTSMVRAYDWNDGMLAQGGGHPSDMIPAVIAAGETVHANGEQILLGVTLAYELLGALGNVAPTRARGWDQGTFMGVAAALAVGRMLDLTEDQLANAVSLALVPHIPLRVNRTGLLSMWKGCASASAMQSALFAVRLARHGMTGPDEPFEGKSGLFEQVTGAFELTLPADPGGRMVVQISHLKQYPAETHSQALLGLIPAVRAWRPVERIESIEIETYWQAYHEIAMHPSKWDPTTRETADHSLPYLLALALVDGHIDTQTSFTPERIADPALRPVMRKISVTEDKEFTAGFRPPGKGISGAPRARLIVTATDGERFSEEVGFHRGHFRNPMSRADIDAKFDAASARRLSGPDRDRIRQAWWAVADTPDITELMALTGTFDGSS